jgi:hypothetical protein
MLSQEQFMSSLRQILPAIGWVLMLSGKVTPETWGTFVSVVPPAIGGLIVIGSAAWALIASTRASLVAKLAKMDVTSVDVKSNGQATITIHDVALSKTAKDSATPTVH